MRYEYNACYNQLRVANEVIVSSIRDENQILKTPMGFIPVLFERLHHPKATKMFIVHMVGR